MQLVKFVLRYTAIEVRNLGRAVDFYTQIMGMRLINRVKIPETNGEFAIVKSENSEHWLEINWYEGHACKSGDELDHIAFEVENLEAALAELKSKGIEPVSYTRETPRAR
jgi:catechol 2,3-dioxygenase-like lactoylglutathione lyase family enzyme